MTIILAKRLTLDGYWLQYETILLNIWAFD